MEVAAEVSPEVHGLLKPAGRQGRNRRVTEIGSAKGAASISDHAFFDDNFNRESPAINARRADVQEPSGCVLSGVSKCLN